MPPEAMPVSPTVEATSAVLPPESRPGVSKPNPILTARGLVRSFGAFKAVDIQNLEIQEGVITALIGPNGAGKTTFFNLATGFDDTSEGSCWFQDQRITGLHNYQICLLYTSPSPRD